MRFQFCSAALLMLGISIANAQVASHSPTSIKAELDSKAAASNSTESLVTGKAVARVNGTALTDRELLREMYSLFPYAQQHGGGFPKDLEPQIRKGALDMIIFEELAFQEAKRRNMTVPAAQLTQAEAAFRKQFRSQAEYKLYLGIEANGSRQVMRDKIRRSLLIEAFLKSEVYKPATVTPLQAKAYYDKNPGKFQRNETFHIQSISILPPQNSNPEVVKEARKRAEEAYKQAKDAKNYKEFGLLAEKFSDDDFHVNMGDHKPVEREKLPPPVVKAASTMKPGQVSELIQLGNAYTIFRLEAHIPAGKVPFEEVKKKLREDLQKEKTQQIRSALGQKLRKGAKIETL